MFFKHFASKNQRPGFYISETVKNGLSICSASTVLTNRILHVRQAAMFTSQCLFRVCNIFFMLPASHYDTRHVPPIRKTTSSDFHEMQ